jgi:drug/metabolite transporter (DMT)-like permease
LSSIGQIAALTAAFFWGGTAILFSAAGRRIGAFATNLLRILLASLFLCSTLWLTTGHFLPMHATAEQIKWLSISGIVGLALGDAALFSCMVTLGPRIATLLLSLAPPITTLVAWIFMGEKLNAMAVAGIVVTLAGIYWVVMEEHSDPVHGSKTKGIVMGLLAAIGQGVGIIFAKKAFSSEIDPLSATVLRMLPAMIALWSVALFRGRIVEVFKTLANRKAALATLGGTIFGPFLGVWLSIVAVKYTEAGVAATLLATVPVIVIPYTMIIYKTRPSLRTLVGTSITIAGVAMLFLR